MVKNYLTFDIEEWYHANYPGYTVDSRLLKRKTHLEALVDQLLALCNKWEVKATFFTVGQVAKKYPKMIERIASQGHELAAHSYKHELVYPMGPKKFFQDADRTKKVLEDLSGKKVWGYRAPSWSVTTESLEWYYQTLVDLGYTYSSSVFPVKTFLYGIPQANPYPHKVKVGSKKILEIPSSTVSILTKRIGFSGGAYLRLLPTPLIKNFTRQINDQNQPVIFYLHPREIDTYQPQLDLPLKEKFLHYYGIRNGFSKLESILSEFSDSMNRPLGASLVKYNKH